MRHLEWSDELSVGVEEIDNDHKRLVGMVNRLSDAVTEHHEQEVIEGILDELIEYTVWHFRHEERLMQTYGDPSFFDHKQEHEDLVEKVLAVQKKFVEGDPNIADEMLPFLQNWLTHHILDTDKRTGKYLAENAV